MVRSCNKKVIGKLKDECKRFRKRDERRARNQEALDPHGKPDDDEGAQDLERQLKSRCKRRKIKGKERSNEPDHWYQDSPRNGIRTMVGRNLDGLKIQGELRRLRIGDRPGYLVKIRLD